MIERDTLVNDLNRMLDIKNFQDYGPNGLQIEGTDKLTKIAFAVSATKYSIGKAAELNADALIVHHGLFWKFHGPKTITGAFYKRVAPLVKNDINLLGYHLPLDAHIEHGNAAGIAEELGLVDLTPFGNHKGMPTGVSGKFESPVSPADLKLKLSKILNHDILHSSPDDKEISTIGIITGGANGDWRSAKANGIDSYLTGEMSEHDWHEASEDNIHFFAGGHNATEEFGVQRLMKYLHDKYKDSSCEFFFIPSSNPA